METDVLPAEADELRAFATGLTEVICDVVARERAGAEARIKQDGSPVTGVDLAVEEALRARIESTYPQHGILGEELPLRNAEAEWTWVIDPIDGTSQFAAGLPNYGSLVALCRHGIPRLGIICQPDTRDVYLGVAGLGAWLNGVPIETAAVTQLGAANLCITDPDAFDGDVRAGMLRLRRAARWHLYEGGCLSFGALAAGRIGVSIYGSNIENFDLCALVPVVEGAGGVITDWQGGALTVESSGEIVASANRALHDAVLELLDNEPRR